MGGHVLNILEHFHPVSPANISYISSTVKDGESSKEDVERLFKTVCYHVKNNEPIPTELGQYLAGAFNRFFCGATLESAFGLRKGKSGRNKIDKLESTEIALCFLRYRLKGHTWDDAIENTCKKVNKSKSVVENSWKKQRHKAILSLRLERVLADLPWHEKELQKLREIFKNDPRFIAPENWGKKQG